MNNLKPLVWYFSPGAKADIAESIAGRYLVYQISPGRWKCCPPNSKAKASRSELAAKNMAFDHYKKQIESLFEENKK